MAGHVPIPGQTVCQREMEIWFCMDVPLLVQYLWVSRHWYVYLRCDVSCSKLSSLCHLKYDGVSQQEIPGSMTGYESPRWKISNSLVIAPGFWRSIAWSNGHYEKEIIARTTRVVAGASTYEETRMPGWSRGESRGNSVRPLPTRVSRPQWALAGSGRLWPALAASTSSPPNIASFSPSSSPSRIFHQAHFSLPACLRWAWIIFYTLPRPITRWSPTQRRSDSTPMYTSYVSWRGRV